MAISSLGVASGLDLETMLTQLMQIEQRPLQMLATKQESYNTKLSAYSMVQSALSTFQTAVKGLSSISQYQKTTTSSSNTDLATLSAGTTATNGTYSLKVSQLAQSQKLVAGGLASDKTAVGNGTITIDFGQISGGTYDSATGKYTDAAFASNSSGIKTIEIGSSNNTLAGIRDAINAANTGVTASIVNDGSGTPYRLTLSNSATGETQSMKIAVDGDQALQDLLAYDPTANAGQNLSQTVAAQNSKFTLDGIEISKATNSVSDTIAGVTIKLLSTSTDKTSTLTVTRDTSAAKTAVTDLVAAYNSLTSTLKELTTYNADEQTASVLTGDSAVRSIQSALKSVFQQPISGGTQGYRTLGDVGVTLDKDGVLSVDSTKLGTALETNFDAFTAMFAEGGMSSNPAITFTDAAAYTKTGSFEVDITQVATKGTYAFTLAAQGSNLSAATAEQRTMQVTIGSVSKSITLDAKNYGTDAALAAELQSKINSAFKTSSTSVSVAAKNGTFTMTEGTWGSGSKVSIAETGGLFTNKVQTDGLDVAGTINGQAAMGTGQTLTGASGTDAYGMKLTVTGDEKVHGTVSFTQGYAYQFTKVAGNLLQDNGVIKSRIDGINRTLKQVEKDYTTYEERIARTEALYRKQFTALDTLVAGLNSQSTYLTQQLAALSSMWNSSKS